MTAKPAAVPAPGADPVYEDYLNPNDCAYCGDSWDGEPIKHVDGRPGWKCMTCRWWNWLPRKRNLS